MAWHPQNYAQTQFKPSAELAKHEEEGNANWAAIIDQHDPYVAHVIPLNDKRHHSEDCGIDCWCDPTMESATDDESYTVFVHNSADGREFSEPDYTCRRTIQ